MQCNWFVNCSKIADSYCWHHASGKKIAICKFCKEKILKLKTKCFAEFKNNELEVTTPHGMKIIVKPFEFDDFFKDGGMEGQTLIPSYWFNLNKKD